MNALFFGVYGTSLRAIENSPFSNDMGSYTKIFLAGCAGGAAQLVVACPVDVVKIKLQTQTGAFKFVLNINGGTK
jgi:solute carrier family 25 protein 45/47